MSQRDETRSRNVILEMESTQQKNCESSVPRLNVVQPMILEMRCVCVLVENADARASAEVAPRVRKTFATRNGAIARRVKRCPNTADTLDTPQRRMSSDPRD